MKGVLWGYEYLAASDILHENTQWNKVLNSIKQSYIGILGKKKILLQSPFAELLLRCLSLISHKIAQVRWLLTTVNKHTLMVVITVKLTFNELTVLTLTNVHSRPCTSLDNYHWVITALPCLDLMVDVLCQTINSKTLLKALQTL